MRSWGVAALTAAVLLLVASTAVSATLGTDDPARGSDSAPRRSESAPGHADRPGKARNDAWKSLSPAQKANLMQKLTREHADGMRAWEACKAAGRDDCARPVPPGHAKRR
jgi:hypothetical protein